MQAMVTDTHGRAEGHDPEPAHGARPRPAPGAWAAAALVGLTAGCGPSLSPTTGSLAGLYDRAAKTDDPARNPLIIVPGFLGSRLVEKPSGTVVWGAFSGESVNPKRPEGAALVALPMAPGTPLAALRDEVAEDEGLDRRQGSGLGLPVELDVYRRILAALEAGGYRAEAPAASGGGGAAAPRCFRFDYDWRRDVVENARRLFAHIREKREAVLAARGQGEGESGAEVRFDIVAQGMGGLLVRYMLRYGEVDLPDDPSTPPEITWSGAAHVDRVILVETPNAGSIGALRRLVEGVRFGTFGARYEPAVFGTMPGLYQLLPRPRHGAAVAGEGVLDILDSTVWEHMGWGLADPEQDEVLRMLLPEVEDPAARRRIAREHLGKCLRRARGFFAALDVPAAAPPGLTLSLIAGDRRPTAAVVDVRSPQPLRTIERRPGDGAVLRSSALMDERLGGPWQRELKTPIDWSQVTFLAGDRVGLIANPAFTDNLLYQLLEAPRGR